MTPGLAVDAPSLPAATQHVQVKAGPGVPNASVGGFGHTQRAGSGQRVDVTGHVACSFVKLLEILDELERGGEQ